MELGLKFSWKNFNPLKNLALLGAKPPDGRIPPLDGLRALAILWLIGYHFVFILGLFYPPQLFRPILFRPEISWLYSGHLGVDIFFVLSGFLIGNLLLKEIKKTGGLNLKRFYFRRAYRILPAYFAVLFLLSFLLKENLGNIWANFLYVNNFLPMDRQYMSWTWSLAIEEQFYLVVPWFLLLLFHLPRGRLVALLLLFLLSFIITYLVVLHHELQAPIAVHPAFGNVSLLRYADAVHDKPYTRYGGLLLGVIAAYLVQFCDALRFLQNRPRLSLTLWVLALFIVAGFHLRPWHEEFFFRYFRVILASYRNVYSMAVAYILLASLAPIRGGLIVTRFLSLRVWYPIAQLSYSAFLLSPILFYIYMKYILNLERVPGSATLFLWLGSLVLLTFGAASLLYSVVERPMMESRKG